MILWTIKWPKSEVQTMLVFAQTVTYGNSPSNLAIYITCSITIIALDSSIVIQLFHNSPIIIVLICQLRGILWSYNNTYKNFHQDKL